MPRISRRLKSALAEIIGNIGGRKNEEHDVEIIGRITSSGANILNTLPWIGIGAG
jgi:hypothetical protein